MVREWEIKPKVTWQVGKDQKDHRPAGRPQERTEYN